MTQNAKRTSRLGAACYVFTAFFMGLWAATQFVAWRVAYHPSLGPNRMESIRRGIFSSGGGKAGMMLSPIFFWPEVRRARG